ncbi:hypothetical protein OKJ48_12145, partial [Streptomyces kunmingensis]
MPAPGVRTGAPTLAFVSAAPPAAMASLTCRARSARPSIVLFALAAASMASLSCRARSARTVRPAPSAGRSGP